MSPTLRKQFSTAVWTAPTGRERSPTYRSKAKPWVKTQPGRISGRVVTRQTRHFDDGYSPLHLESLPKIS